MKDGEDIKVFLVLFLQKENTSSFSEEKEAKRLLFLEAAGPCVSRL
jgi:hypothetical protein